MDVRTVRYEAICSLSRSICVVFVVPASALAQILNIQVLTDCSSAGHPDIITNKPETLVYCTISIQADGSLCKMCVDILQKKRSEAGVVQYDTISCCHHLLFLETGIFISHEQVQHQSSLGTDCSSSSAPFPMEFLHLFFAIRAENSSE